MLVRKRKINQFDIIGKPDGTEIECSGLEELKTIDWVAEAYHDPNSINLFYSTSESMDYLMVLEKTENGIIFGHVIGYIFGSGKELGLESSDEYISKERIKNKLKND